MKKTQTPLAGVLLLEPTVHRDHRGRFLELFQAERYQAIGIPPFVQDNVSYSGPRVLRGLHYQHPRGQGKLVSVLAGAIWDIAVDIQPDSPTFRQYFATTLSEENHHQLYIPPGYAHGFQVLTPNATVLYKCTEYYHPNNEGTVRWDDPGLAIPWPILALEGGSSQVVLNAKDQNAPLLEAIPRNRLPHGSDDIPPKVG